MTSWKKLPGRRVGIISVTYLCDKDVVNIKDLQENECICWKNGIFTEQTG